MMKTILGLSPSSFDDSEVQDISDMQTEIRKTKLLGTMIIEYNYE